jgi:hypothetical protein
MFTKPISLSRERMMGVVVQVSSRAIQQVEYFKETGEMDVLFTDGQFTTYLNVPYKVFAEFISAGSVGEYFNHNIRGKYAFRQ